MSKSFNFNHTNDTIFGSRKMFNNPPFALDKVSDIYSLGSILLELSNYRNSSHKERPINKICLKKDREKLEMVSNLQLKPLEPVYLNTARKNYCAVHPARTY